MNKGKKRKETAIDIKKNCENIINFFRPTSISLSAETYIYI